jgi:hypothetical protein
MRDGPRLDWQNNGTRARARARLSKVCKVVANMAPLMAIAFTQIASGQLGRRLPPSTPFALIRDPRGQKEGECFMEKAVGNQPANHRRAPNGTNS